MAYSCGVLTVSDKGARGERADASGEYLKKMLTDAGFCCLAHAIIPDEKEIISRVLIEWTDELGIDLIVTCGGTGLSPRDVTPEATMAVIDRYIPGIGEIMRQASFKQTPFAMLSRGVAGIRGKSLIINLPGSLAAARENIAVVLAALSHALAKIKGDENDCGREGG